MPSWKKSPPELIALFDALVEQLPGVERRSMFGYPCIFLNGNMAAGLFEDRMMMRLGEKDRAAFLAQGARLFEPMKGRPMREYVELPDAMLASKKQISAWLAKSVAYVGGLPVKRANKKTTTRTGARAAAGRKAARGRTR